MQTYNGCNINYILNLNKAVLKNVQWIRIVQDIKLSHVYAAESLWILTNMYVCMLNKWTNIDSSQINDIRDYIYI
jgi:hypothetical protein